MMHARCLAIATLTLCSGSVLAADIYVSPTGDDANPGTEAMPLATIDAAVAAATSGDTIYLKPGTYEGPEHRGHEITFDLSIIGDGPAGSVVCSGADVVIDSFEATEVRFARATDAAINVDNITFSSFALVSLNEGGAVFSCTGGSLTLTGCVVTDTNVFFSSGEDGATLRTDNTLVTMAECEFRDNLVFSDVEVIRDNGGILAASDQPVLIQDCLFVNNGTASTIYTERSPSVTITNCVFEGNDGGPGLHATGSNGGPVTVTDCSFLNNDASNIGGFSGSPGAIHATFIESLTVDRCVFFRNRGYADIDCIESDGGAIRVSQTPTSIMNSAFVGNAFRTGCDFPPDSEVPLEFPQPDGLAIASRNATVEVVNCTFAFHQEQIGLTYISNPSQSRATFGTDLLNGGSINVTNSIFIEPNGIVVPGRSDVTFASSVSSLPEAHPGLTIVDPMLESVPANANGLGADFASVDLHLSSGSPAIDAGDNAAVTSTLDLDTNTRIVDGDGDGTDTVDLGAYETQAAHCIADFSGDGVANIVDINAFVNAFLAMDPAADLNSDGQFNNIDINLFVVAFLAGCD